MSFNVLEETCLKENDLQELEKNQEYAIIMSKEISSMELKKAKQLYKELMLFAKENDLRKAYSWFNYYLAWVYYDLLDLEKAIELHKKGLELFRDMNHIQGILVSINALFGCYISLQMFDDAIELGVEGIELARESNNYEILGIIKANMLAVYVEIEEYEKGIEVYEELEKSTFLFDTNNEIVNLLNRGVCETKLEHIENAKKYLGKAYEKAVDTSSYLAPAILAETAALYIQMESYDTAMEFIEKGFSYMEEDTSSEIYIELVEVQGDLELKRKNYIGALEKYKKVYENIYDKKWRKKEKGICKRLSQVYEKLKDHKSANQYLERYIEINEEIQKMRSNEKLKVLNDKKQEEEQKAYKALYNQTEALYQFGQMITSNLQKEDILRMIAKEIKGVMYYDVVQIILYKEEEEVFEYSVFLQEGKEIHCDPIPMEEESLAGYCVKNKKQVLIHDINDEFYRYIAWDKYVIETVPRDENRPNCNSAIFVPIEINDKVIGVISVQSYQKNQYDTNDASTMKIMCSFVGIALENAKLYRQVQYLATYDSLTKVFSRREALRRGKERYQMLKESHKSRIAIMIDIDDFKRVNDTYGHIVGDQVISKVALTIKNTLGKEDIVGRYGGEEFIIFLAHGEANRGREIAEAIRENVEKIEVSSAQGTIKVTISLGVIITEKEGLSIQEIINYADNELYKAKKSGKNRVSIYDSSM